MSLYPCMLLSAFMTFLIHSTSGHNIFIIGYVKVSWNQLDRPTQEQTSRQAFKCKLKSGHQYTLSAMLLLFYMFSFLYLLNCLKERNLHTQTIHMCKCVRQKQRLEERENPVHCSCHSIKTTLKKT